MLIEKPLVEDLKETGLSIIPELSGLLTPEIVSDPTLVFAKVGANILASKLTKIIREILDKNTKGEINLNTPKAADTLYDILKYINKEVPEEEKINAIKKLFLKATKTDANYEETLVGYELIQICKKLSVNELRVLVAAYEIQNGINLPQNLPGDIASRYRKTWHLAIALKLGHQYLALVESAEDNLITLRLITPNEPGSPDKYYPTGKTRLTDLGIGMGEFLLQEENESI